MNADRRKRQNGKEAGYEKQRMDADGRNGRNGRSRTDNTEEQERSRSAQKTAEALVKRRGEKREIRSGKKETAECKTANWKVKLPAPRGGASAQSKSGTRRSMQPVRVGPRSAPFLPAPRDGASGRSRVKSISFAAGRGRTLYFCRL